MIKVLGIFGFLTFSFVDLLDIVMVAAILFFLFRGVRKDTTVLNILLVLAALLLLQTVVNALGMRMMTALMNALLDVGVLALIIIFQPEIRHLLNRLKCPFPKLFRCSGCLILDIVIHHFVPPSE